MRRFYRWMRRGMAALFICAVGAAVIYYLLYTVSGIIKEVDQRNTLRDRDALLIGTATALAPTVEAESLALASFTSELATEESIPTEEPATEEAVEISQLPTGIPVVQSATQVAPSETPLLPSETPAPSATATRTPTETRIPTDTKTPTLTQTPTDELPTVIPTNTSRPTAFPTNTPRPSATLMPTETLTPTLTLTPSATLTPSVTPTASLTPTASRTPSPTSSPYPIEGTYATPVVTPIVDINPRAPLVENDPNIVNIALLGSDTYGGGVRQTDVIILVTVNKELGTVSMWHIPRDLLVYIPGYTVDRINVAYLMGVRNGFPGGGPGLLKETILYNFGIEVDYYVGVDFSDFQRIIEQLGGLKVGVDCQLTDWALISPELDQTVVENWEEYTLGIGMQTLNPYYALWYARSRVTTSDLDRGRRQMDVLRAIWRQSRDVGILSQVTDLWPEASEIIDTDLELDDILGFVPLANNLEINKIERFYGAIGVHYANFSTPDDGRSVLLPNWEKIYELVRNFVTPATGNRVDRQATIIEVYDGSAYGIGFDQLAAERLAWEGFAAIPMGQTGGSIREVTLIYDYTGAAKGSALQEVLDIVRAGPSQVIIEPDANRTVDFRIEMGRNYNSCFLSSSADEPPVELQETAPGEAPVGTETEEAEPSTVG